MGKVGRYGMFGGQYVPETVMNAVHELKLPMKKQRQTRLSGKNIAHSVGIMQTVHPCCIMQNG